MRGGCGGGEAVNLGVARTKGETKEEKKARKEAVKQQVAAPPLLLCSSHSFPQRSANRAAKKQLKDACGFPSATINASSSSSSSPPFPLPAHLPLQLHRRNYPPRACGGKAKLAAGVTFHRSGACIRAASIRIALCCAVQRWKRK